MSAASRSPVVIIGAGPVGVTAALLLARHGVRSLILERHQDIYPLPRAVAMDDEIRRILQSAGIHEEFAARARPARGLRLLDARHRLIAEFPRSPHGHHGFPQTSMFDQPELERLLRNALARRPECELRGGVEVVSVTQDTDGTNDSTGPVQVSFRRDGSDEEETVWADAVLGCDGAGSLTRDAIGAVWEDLHFEESWRVVDVRTSRQVRTWEGVEQICCPTRPATFMRVGEDRYRWEFRLPEDERLDGPDGLERLRDLVAPWVDLPQGALPGDDFEVLRQAQYTFRARLADRWRRGRIFLLGDAAHLTPPFIGQGLCAGLRDAHNLTWKLAQVLQQGADEELLDTYERERKPHARHVIRLAVAVGWAMTGGQDRAAALRRALVGAACRIPGVTATVSRDLSPALTAGPLVRCRPRLVGRVLAGTFCPQPWVVVDGRRVRLDDVLGDSFAILTTMPPAPQVTAVAAALGAPVIRVEDLRDDGTVTAWLARGRADAVLLRPDRVVMDTVPAGTGDFTGTAAWAPLLHTAHRPAHARSAPSPRSTTP
ncbi:bifunctional 3-(3-hydroxy-phenyl)propionate/3-hydroxycinnamic acid hydroxylase [Streptomyces sp. NPDC093228]|uniref:bifunctional 3-(3-hydroxy-phenyl)propionate/3-hydroxycinnamic acid hydroxylase MhpA n=1 Tax=unclassified Streptomyces TaxID=2593676 RepID=UPI0007412C86|nr:MULTISPECIES: bifunctional 3-(3-hydroxy-phenyl)propionate/3-hydroxycinnamic acid hydroxylase [unclassified Streptomyces]KUJ35980.1 3-(3-hydroxyphenyl)propionate hydroxylase [Streptomyces sp. NRRL F-5122]MDX3262082.1 bifunctional 3-(3-hydroxy-phenyl)propionate/3-hydroxycinnamic acid hydroxylase [Streptomyces sp. MI02-2A]REE65868.1 3-(3-hydroxy-phenyl)propionate hydroxylase [Streptomyces sp. 3212.3]